MSVISAVYDGSMGFKFENLSVLIVEDTVPMRKLVVSVLETLGIGKIFTAQDGDQGFEIFCSQNPDIVICDWHMIPTSGIELVRRIRKSAQSPNKVAPVIMMTGYSAMPRVSEARDSGATEFLVKPFSANDLARRIAYVINKPRDFIDTGEFFGPDRRRKVIDNFKGPFRRNEDR
jgi:CheY-like chemotaxis protein